MARAVEDRIQEAQEAFEAGFQSEAARKRALDQLNRAYDDLHQKVMRAILDARVMAADGESYVEDEQNSKDYWGHQSQLHLVKAKDFEIAARYGVAEFLVAHDLIELRKAIKAAEIVKHERPANEAKVEAVRKSILEEMEFRKAQFVEGMEVARHFKGLPVSVNAHMVYGHKGARFIRHFFYLRGKLTALNMIMAIADAYEREQEGKV